MPGVVTCMLVLLLTSAAPPPSTGLGPARAALKKKDVRGARKALAAPLSSSDHALRLDALMLAAEVELADRKEGRALRRWREALLHAEDGPTAERDRAKVLRRMASSSGANAGKAVTDLAAAHRSADDAVKTAVRWPVLPPADAALAPDRAALEAAVTTYRTAGLKARTAAARRALAVALAHGGDRSALSVAREAVSSCTTRKQTDPVCRTEALTSLIRARLLLAQDVQALEPALKESHEIDEQQRPGDRYRRSALTALVCARMDAAGGEGACRKSESALGLSPTFRDFSTGAPTATLSETAVATTHGEYAFLLSRCLQAAAREDPDIAGTRVELSWAVQPDGRADDVTIDPRGLRDHRAGQCLREALSYFRYARYRSQERRVIALALQVGG